MKNLKEMIEFVEMLIWATGLLFIVYVAAAILARLGWILL